MNRRTFEVLARWIAKEQKINIEFGEKGPCADVKNNRIFLPYEIKDANVFAVLAWLMHEAAHLKYSKFPDDLAKGPISHGILNAIEDIRIDLKNFNLLPNIEDFYTRMVKDHVYPKAEEIKKQPLLTRALINTILTSEGFVQIKDGEAIKKASETNLGGLSYDLKQALEDKNWNKVKELIAEIMKRFGVKDPDQPPGGGGGIGEGSKDGLGIEKFLHPDSMWGKGTLYGPSAEATSPAALRDITKESLKELLNIKETRVVHDGTKLDTDNLTDFFTGEIENLFKDDDIIKKRKSKIVFLLDASGSMSGTLLDNQPRRTVLTKCVKAMTQILDEIRESDGLDVNYEVNAFTEDLHPLNQNNWEAEYSRLSGGTTIIDTFRKTQTALLADQEIDGKKLVIVITDGEVSADEIEQVRQEILRHNEDVRCMFIGIGTQIKSPFMEQIIRDNNIMMEDMADQIIMDVIMQML